MTPKFLDIKLAKSALSLVLVALLTLAAIPANPSFALETASDADIILYGILGDSGLLVDAYSVEVTQENGAAIYQQSREKALELPWTFSLKYTLDGKTLVPTELAGKTGKLGIQITVNQNTLVQTDEFKRYALQVVMSLPADQASNLVAPGATVVYKGNEQQAIFTLLPGEAHTSQITCDMTNLEMAPILISAVPMSLAIDLPSTGDAQDQFNTLMDGTKGLKDGTKALNKGIEQLLVGLKPLEQGASQLSASLSDGGQSHQAIKNLQDTNQQFILQAKQQVQQLEKMMVMAQADPAQLATLKGQYQGLMETIMLIEANQKVITEQALGIQTLSKHVFDLAGGLKKVVAAVAQLSTGSQKLAKGTAELDSEIQSSRADINGMLVQLKRLEPIVKSPNVDDETTNDTQYVIRTGAINLPEVASIEEKEDNPSFWDRLLLLFGVKV